MWKASNSRSKAASWSCRSCTSPAFSLARSHEYPNIPGESGVRFAYPLARTDSGVSRKRKNSYSEATFTANPIERAFSSIRLRSWRGETASGFPGSASKSSRKAAVPGSHGIMRKVERSTVARTSG